MKNPVSNKLCEGPKCYAFFPRSKRKKRFCSDVCAQKYKATHGSTCNIGAVGELRVAADLLAQGYEVFRSVSPTTSCDLVILKHGTLRRVEVRTGHSNIKGKLTAANRTHRADILAIIEKDKVQYEPEL